MNIPRLYNNEPWVRIFFCPYNGPSFEQKLRHWLQRWGLITLILVCATPALAQPQSFMEVRPDGSIRTYEVERQGNSTTVWEYGPRGPNMTVGQKYPDGSTVILQPVRPAPPTVMGILTAPDPEASEDGD